MPQAHPAVDELRALARERENISVQIVALKNEIKRYLGIVFPEILSLLNPFTASSLRLLAAFPSKEAFLQASPQALLQILAGASRARKSTLSSQLLIDTARTSIGLASPDLEAILRSKIRILERLQAELEEMTDRLAQMHVEIPPVQELLGHLNPSTTFLYTHTSLERKRAAISAS